MNSEKMQETVRAFIASARERFFEPMGRHEKPTLDGLTGWLHTWSTLLLAAATGGDVQGASIASGLMLTGLGRAEKPIGPRLSPRHGKECLCCADFAATIEVVNEWTKRTDAQIVVTGEVAEKLKKVAEVTNGTPNGLLETAIRQLHNKYVLSYRPPPEGFR